MNFCTCNRTYSERYDNYYCETCDKWLEPKCSDETCVFCKERPEKPSMVK